MNIKIGSAIHSVSSAIRNNQPKMKTAVAFVQDGKRYITVTATRFGKPNKRPPSVSMVLTIGRPNYRARQYLALCRRAKVSPRPFWYPGFR